MAKTEDMIQTSKLNMASYGFGKLLNEFLDMAFVSYSFFYYERALGLESLLVGLGFLIFAVYNAINDPLVGYLTNRPFKFTKKWGRRKPWIIIGGALWLTSYLLIFTPPTRDPIGGTWILFAWLLFSTCIYDTFSSIFFVNFSSLFPDKWRSVKSRRLATGIQTPIGVFGVALGALIPPLIITDNSNADLYLIQAGLLVIIGFVVLGISIPGYKEDQRYIDSYLASYDEEQRELKFFKSLREALKVKSFRVFIISYTLYRCLVISMQASIPYVVEFILKEVTLIQTLLSAAFLVGALISSPLWAFIAQKTNNNKRTMLIGSILMTVFTFPFFFYNTITLMFIGFLFFGFGLGSYWTLISAVLADIIDESVVKYEKREEGIYNGFLQFFGRLGLLFQVVIFALVHSLTNLQEGQGHVGQPESAFFGVLLHFSLIPAIVMLIGTLIFWKYYKLTPDIVTQNQLKVKELGL